MEKYILPAMFANDVLMAAGYATGHDSVGFFELIIIMIFAPLILMLTAVAIPMICIAIYIPLKHMVDASTSIFKRKSLK